MSIAARNVRFEHCDRGKLLTSLDKLPMVNEVIMEVEDDEDDDDVDFSPTWRGETPSEASSGLSSDNEVLGEDAGEVPSKSPKQHNNDCASSTALHCNIVSGTEDENNILHKRLSDENVSVKDAVSPKAEPGESNKLVQQKEEIACPEASYKKVASGDESDAPEQLAKEELPEQTRDSLNETSSRNPVIKIDDEDAICKRTRARHSLADYTLEELEAFLHESDDDGELQNVDEEDEYRKFLAAVLLEGNENGQAGRDDEILDDEENDTDFAIEIEEALESDIDEGFDDEKRSNDKSEDESHRPETRQKKRLRESVEKRKCFIGLEKIPLRPILPYVSNGQIATVPALGLRFSSPENFSCFPFAFSGTEITHGFTHHQLGQLYCLIHEHVQFLVQIFSISVLDPSRQQVAMELQELIMEMITRHEEALSRRKAPYDMSCFQSLNLHASLQIDSSESSEFSHWTPLIDRPIFSILDVPPLRLVKSYMAGVSSTILKYRQSHVEDPAEKSHLKREPLFPFPVLASHMGADDTLPSDPNSSSARINSPLSPSQLPLKRSLAATLVENTKKQTVALVPMDIAKLAQRFYSLFNLALFPHKPPLSAVSNRVLFTDAEDGLLAMGLMKYNSDWEAIRKHFLPCKSKHQIFVRQKNRSSSKAPDNPIKTVRRMKTSPLTADEKARIYEGLKLFKQDWLSVWKVFVPHRDPSLLPRQWRIATGTQKSYRKSEAIKEKRRLYEARRRRLKASTGDGNMLSEKEVDDDGYNSGEDMDNENEAYVHEAFLEDPESGSSNNLSYEISLSGICRSNIQFMNMMHYDGTHASGKSASSSESIPVCKESGLGDLNIPVKPTTITNPLSHSTDIRYTSQSNLKSSISNLRTSGNHFGSLPDPARKGKGARVVKLAPGLPPINLPPSVRVISQSVLQNHPNGSSHSYMGKNESRNPSKSPVAVKRGSNLTAPRENPNTNGPETNNCQDGAISDQYVAEENASQSDLQMHPLLFHAPDVQFSSYYLMSRYTTTSSPFLLGDQLQKESIFSKSEHLATTKDTNNAVKKHREAPLDLFSVDFHPLMQRTDNASADISMFPSVDRTSGCLAESHSTMKENLSGRANLCHYEKRSKLDLDIRLYSTTEKEQRRARDAASNESGSPKMWQRIVERGMDSNTSTRLSSKEGSEVAGPDDILARSGGFCSTAANSSEVAQVPDDCPSRCINCYEEPNLHIVMEQEELSDSDDESAHVEFECEEIDDSEDDESEYVRHKEALNKELPTSPALSDNNQDNYNFSHSHQSVSIRLKSADEGNRTSPGWSSQNLSSAQISQIKPKQENTNGEISNSSQSSVQSPGQFSKARNPKSSKMQSLGPTDHPVQSDYECRTVASRKPRKRSVCK